jgi:hypothetical protein
MNLGRPRNDASHSSFMSRTRQKDEVRIDESENAKTRRIGTPGTDAALAGSSSDSTAKALNVDSFVPTAGPGGSGTVIGAVKEQEGRRTAARKWAKSMKRRADRSGLTTPISATDTQADKFKSEAVLLIKQHKSLFGLDEKGLGRALADLALKNPGDNLQLIGEVFHALKVKPDILGGDNKGQVGIHMLRALSDQDIGNLNGSRDGESVLGIVRRAIKSSGITFKEAKQLSRLSPFANRRPSAEQLQEIQTLIHSGEREKAIEKAIEYYKIDVSLTTNIRINPELPREKPGRINQIAEVEIGPSAFDSPAMLAATLSHECEVHAKQIHENRWYSTERGISLNEIEGYDHVILNATRFGLSDLELREILAKREEFYETLAAFYPEIRHQSDDEDYKISGEE